MTTNTPPRPRYAAGEKYRVVKTGAALRGMKSVPGHSNAWDGWGRELAVGDVLTCKGTSMSWGSDGMPIVKWAAVNDVPFERGVLDAEFYPSEFLAPRPGYLELVS